MAIVTAKPAVRPTAAPIQQQHVAAPAAPVAAPTAGAAIVEEDDAAKPVRKTRKDFNTNAEFYDYKIGVCADNVQKWTDRKAIWEQKKANPQAEVADKAAKKAEKLTAALIAVWRNMRVPEAEITRKLAQMSTQGPVTA